MVLHIAALTPPTHLCRSRQYIPVTRDCVIESEVWMLRLGNIGKDQFDLLPGHLSWECR
jgi:hypothetical protein